MATGDQRNLRLTNADRTASEGSKPIISYLRKFVRFAGWKIWIFIALMVLLGFTQGIGLLMLLPLLGIIGIGDSGAPEGQILTVIKEFFFETGIPLNLPAVLVFYILIVAIQAMATYYQQVLNAELTNGFTQYLRNRFNQALTYTGWLTHIRTRAADITHVLTSEIGRVAGITQQVMVVPGSVLVAAVQLGVAFSISPPMTAVALVCGGCLLLVMRPYNRKVQLAGKALRDSTNSLFSSIMEFIAGMKVAKSYGLEETHLAVFRQNSAEIARQLVCFTRTISKPGMYFQIGTAVAVSAFLWTAVAIVHLPAERLLVLVFIFSRLLPKFRQIQQSYHQILHAMPAFEAATKMQRLLEQDQESAVHENFDHISVKNAVQFQKVSFKYNKSHDTYAVHALDLTIPARRMTAIVGPSGAGKSTLADLMMGLLAPDEGGIFIDALPLSGERLHGWRRSVGYVPQENFLFNDTIRGNLVWAKSDAIESEMRRALESAMALDFVMALPQGLDTVVGDRGVRLSGGERQRIALARALLRNPTLLLLDEATSSLDSENERRVQQAVERLHGDITVVVIAHRLSTVSRADQVILLDEGRVVETGSWKELMQSPHCRFYEMTENQRYTLS
jgi:ATP-binding cassette subfamily C protein